MSTLQREANESTNGNGWAHQEGEALRRACTRAAAIALKGIPHLSSDEVDELASKVQMELLAKPRAEVTNLDALALTIARRLATDDLRHEQVRARDDADGAIAVMSEATVGSRGTARAPGRPAGKPFDNLDDLRRAVRAKCEAEFLSFANIPWDGSLAFRPIEHQPDAERVAQTLLPRLVSSLREIKEFLDRVESIGLSRSPLLDAPTVAFLRDHIGPIVKRAAFQRAREPETQGQAIVFDFVGPDLGLPPVDGLAWFIEKWERADYLDRRLDGLEQQMAEARKRRLATPAGDEEPFTIDVATGQSLYSNRALAIIALLTGHFPPGIEAKADAAGGLAEAVSAEAVIRAQTAAVASARLRRAGNAP